MIFSSEAMSELRQKYVDQPNFRVPYIALLDRSDESAGEREYLESLFALAPRTKQKDWLGRLINTNDNHFLGAWFEMMLYGWLRGIGQVTIEPEIKGNFPDFMLNVKDQQIVIEARACLIDAAEREYQKRKDEVWWILEQINKPYMVVIERFVPATGPLLADQLATEAVQWLDDSSDKPLLFEDKNGNQITLVAKLQPTLKKVGLAGPIQTAWLTSEPVIQPLREKAGQHKALRKAGYPYVLAILLEGWKLSAEEVADAWFGRLQATVDVNARKVVKEHLDGTGLHYFGREIRYKSVSGTLVFKASFDKHLKRQQLRAWYIQNPYANAPVDVTLFPVEASFEIVGQGPIEYRMGWRRRS